MSLGHQTSISTSSEGALLAASAAGTGSLPSAGGRPSASLTCSVIYTGPSPNLILNWSRDNDVINTNLSYTNCGQGRICLTSVLSVVVGSYQNETYACTVESTVVNSTSTGNPSSVDVTWSEFENCAQGWRLLDFPIRQIRRQANLYNPIHVTCIICFNAI